MFLKNNTNQLSKDRNTAGNIGKLQIAGIWVKNDVLETK